MADDSEQYISSREKSRAGYGTNGDPNPSSVPLGKNPKLVEPKVAPPDASANPGDWQTRQLKGGNQAPDNVPVHDGFRSRNHEGGTVPAATIRRDSGKRLLK
ncbi:MAG: hypothetical protein JWO19_6122 [Bryobacterales bacterium]|nr:hypothetical protein [Bryobacterales bacterium]